MQARIPDKNSTLVSIPDKQHLLTKHLFKYKMLQHLPVIWIKKMLNEKHLKKSCIEQMRINGTYFVTV